MADVAGRITTEPKTAEHLRGEWLELIEADAAPMSLSTIVALRRVFHFDLRVLYLLEAIAQGAPTDPPRLCRACFCSELDPCMNAVGEACAWHADIDLCTVCSPTVVSVDA